METRQDAEELFRKYERVRQKGKYNMITEAVMAAHEANLTLSEYLWVLDHYYELNDKYTNIINNTGYENKSLHQDL